MRRYVRHIEARTRNIEFPAVIDAANPTLLVAAKVQRRAAMWATMIHYSDPARAVAKCDQLLTEQHQAKRRAVARKFRRHQRGNPVFPHQLTHDGAGADPCQLDAIDRRCHRVLLGACGGPPATRGSYYIRL